MVFTGQGAQWPGCGQSLMERFPVYQKAAVRVDHHFAKLAGYSILEKMRRLSPTELNLVQYAQPVTFMVQVMEWMLYNQQVFWSQ